jgi:hypothetical protein
MIQGNLVALAFLKRNYTVRIYIYIKQIGHVSVYVHLWTSRYGRKSNIRRKIEKKMN